MEHEKKTKSAEIFLYGDVRYHLQSRQIVRKDGSDVHMRRQSAEVLAMLAEHVGQVVGKEALLDRVWHGVVTTDDSLVQCIADIRRVLGRSVIDTFPKRGYRLNPPQQQNDSVDNPPTRRKWRSWLPLAGCAALLLIAVAAVTNRWFAEATDTVVPPIIKQEKTIAVLPFTDLSGSREFVYFSNGLAEDLATDLSKVDGLTVIAYASSLGYPEAERGFRQIAEQLGVRYLVRGTVRHSSEQVRINVSLVDPQEGFNLWAERYDRVRANPFDVQAEVTREIVSALSLELDLESQASSRVQPDAYYMLLRGLESLRALTLKNNQQARTYFERAIALDPGYARAYASVAISHARDRLIEADTHKHAASIEQGLHAAIKAVQLDADLPHAYYALGILNLALGKFDHALSASRHALRLDANYADGYALLAEAGLYGGDLHEALSSIRRARRLHPHHPPFYRWTEGHILFQLGRYDEADPVLQNAWELSDKYSSGLLLVAANAAMLGQQAKARRFIDQFRETGMAERDSLRQIPYAVESRRTSLAQALTIAAR